MARSIRTRVLEEAIVRVADRADEAGAQVVEAAHVVDHRERGDVVEERVDREVAPEGILFRGAEGIVAVHQLVAVGAARRGLLDLGADLVASLGLGLERAASSSGRSWGSGGSSSVPAGTWRRNVATSTTFDPKRMCARRKRRPMIQQLRKSFLTW